MGLDLSTLKFDEKGLIPAVIQDAGTNEVLMMAYMNRESLQKTLETRQTWFWSRSRQELWHKGATSGHFQDVQAIRYDCDADCLLVRVIQHGPACHTGQRSCFHNPMLEDEQREPAGADILNKVYQVVLQRKRERPEGSYTTYLFNKGSDKILKKVGEETAEVIIGAKNESRDEVIYETADLLYHLLVLLGQMDIEPEEVFGELAKRR